MNGDILYQTMQKPIVQSIPKIPVPLQVSLFSLLVPVILYSTRGYDNNSLSRWDWVFSVASPLPLFLLLILTIPAAWFLARRPWPSHHAVLLFLISFITGLFFWSQPEVLMDASRYFTHAKYLKTNGIEAFLQEWGGEISAWTDLPFMSFMYGLIFRFIGESRIYIQILNTLLLSGTVVLTCLLGRTLWDRETGFLAGLLLLCSPYLLLHVSMLMVDLPTMFFLILAVYAFTLAVTRADKGTLLLAGLAVFCALMVKYSNWLYLTLLPVISLVYLRESPRQVIQRSLAVLLVTLVLLIPVALSLADVIREQIALLIQYQKPGLTKWTESYVSIFFFQTHPLLALAAIAGLIAAWRRKEKKFIIPVFLFVLVVILQIKRIRYLMPLFPMLALAAAYGLQQLAPPARRKHLLLVSFCASLILGAGAFLPFTRNLSAVNLQKAGQFLDSMGGDRAGVMTVDKAGSGIRMDINVPILDLFTGKKLQVIQNDQLKEKKAVEESSFRFTWDYQLPSFYVQTEENFSSNQPLVIISPSESPFLPKNIREYTENYKKMTIFNTSTGFFDYKTIVRIFYND